MEFIKVLNKTISIELNNRKNLMNIAFAMKQHDFFEIENSTYKFFNYKFPNNLTFEEIDVFHKKYGKILFQHIDLNLNDYHFTLFKGYLLGKYREQSLINVEDFTDLELMDLFKYGKDVCFYKSFVEFANLNPYLKDKVKYLLYIKYNINTFKI